jgi:Tfp pilus assembly protein PilF
MKNVFAVLVALLMVTAACSNNNEIVSRPENSFAHYYSLGMAAFEKGDYQEAITQFKRSVELKSDVARTQNELGLCYIYMHDYDNAIYHLERALAIDSRMIDVHNNLGAAYLSKKDYAKAEQHFQLLLQSSDYKTKFNPLYNLGNLKMEQNDFDSALTYYLSTLELKVKIPNDQLIYIYFQLGNIYIARGDYKNSLFYFEEALLLNPQLHEAIYNSGCSAMQLGKDDMAEQKFRKLIGLLPNTDWAEKALQKLKELNR